MKKSIFFSLLMMVCFSLFSQEPAKATKDNAIRKPDGNFIALAMVQDMVDSTTTFTYTNTKGVSSPVFKNSKGKYYISRVSGKTGKAYRYYLAYTDSPALK